MTFYNAEAGPPGGIAIPIDRSTNGLPTGTPYRDDIPINDQAYAYLLDGGPGRSGDRFGASIYLGSTPAPADCPAFPDPATLKPLTGGHIDIRDLGGSASAR